MLLGVLWVLAAVAPQAEAAFDAFLKISAIDARGVATAHEEPAGRTVQFAVKDQKVRDKLRVGDKVRGDFERKVVLVLVPGLPPAHYEMTSIT